MKIYSMTATFGKLENQTLTLQPGLNILEAPNEWGKSTWCAFLVAMLYGIDTSQRIRPGVLADKQRYAPWSGQPMSGRIDLHWEGQDITIERSSTARIPFGEFRAYDTASGVPVRELTAANCGLQLLGVEKEVFLRSAFLRLKDLPVTADDSLRRRLNSLVTTGDENNACDDLEQKLKDLKNACRSNRANGLLPQAEAKAEQYRQTIRSLQELNVQIRYNKDRQNEAESELVLLRNHLCSLDYEENKTYHDKLAAAKSAQLTADTRLENAQAACRDLPETEALQQKLSYLQSLQEQRDALQLKVSMLPQPPQLPQVNPPYPGATPDVALEQVRADLAEYEQLAKKAKNKGLLLAGILAILAGGAATQLPIAQALYIGIGVAALGLILTIAALLVSGNLKKRLALLQSKYGALPFDSWLNAAESYVSAQTEYMQLSQEHQAKRDALQQQVALLEQTIAQSVGETSLSQQLQFCQDGLRHRQALSEAQWEADRCRDLTQALQSSYRECPAPTLPDTLTWNREETQHKIAALQVEQKQLQLKLGQFQGQAEALGDEEYLLGQLAQEERRIAKLEQYQQALQYALETLDATKTELQRRFAPQITNRAQTLMQQLTGGRYDRMQLEHDLTLRAGAAGETQTVESMWRSDGTVDQLYLALRLAVSEELLPDAPFILDDALVRYDDVRLAAALRLLQKTGETKQVLLFTCQSREKRALEA